MKLPLKVETNRYGVTQVTDATERIVFRLDRPKDAQFGRDMARKMNRNWRWVLFGQQPYVYKREDWLFEKSKATNAS